jgi:hypothetical protein
MKTGVSIVATLLALVASASSWAGDSSVVDRLGKDLTPAGGEVAGNKDGGIPAWEGELAPLPGWTHDRPRGEFWQFKDEKPLFSIDANNVDTYADRLVPAQIYQIKNTPGYRMDIYPTHRNCTLPEVVQRNTKAAAGKTRIAADGWSLDEAVLPSVPFPEPQSGIEAMWNFQTRYQGVGLEWPIGRTVITAAPGDTGDNKFRWSQVNYYPWAAPGQHGPQAFGGLMTGIFYTVDEPVALAGQALLSRYYFGKAPEPFYYFTGQRRVRRLPSLAYDAPIIGTENQEPMDEMQMFFGNPDRFDWTLLGKKEIYAPYNGFRIADFTAKMSDVLGPRFINPAFRRYELHRLWVLQGTVKAGVRHSAPRKLLYLDEDSWNIVIGEDYDGQGKLWRLNESPVMPAWELHACVSAPLTNLNDLISGRYVADLLILEGKDLKFYSDPSEDRRLKDDFFSGENLRVIMER